MDHQNPIQNHQTPPNSRITPLPDFLINQIKAGEVIERPSNLLKEIIENSFDANAGKISLSISNTGLDQIELKDDGNGMNFHELPFAFKRHSTSKIKSYEDLLNIHSYGFRGEALASIASISKVSCLSYAKNSGESGGKIEIEGGKITKHSPLKKEHDLEYTTKISIKNLFYNTPVRLKFLKSKNHEKVQIKKVIDSFLLTWNQAYFDINFDNKEKRIYPSCLNETDFFNRVLKVFNEEPHSTSEILSFKESASGTEISGFIFIKGKGRANPKQYLFANKRLIVDKSIHQRIVYTLEKYFPSKPIIEYALFITVPPQEIDINVHPHKTFVKFEKGALIHSIIGQAIKNIFIRKEKLNVDYPKHSTEELASFKPNPEEQERKGENQYSSINSLIKLTPEFSLFFSNNIHFIVNENRFVRAIILDFYQEKENADILDHEVYPLLVGESLFYHQVIPLHLIHFLRSVGFNIEIMGEDHYLLRGVPLIFKNFSLLTLLEALINHLLPVPKEDLYQKFIDFWVLEENLFFNLHDLTNPTDMLNKLSFKYDKSYQLEGLKELSQEVLRDLMK